MEKARREGFEHAKKVSSQTSKEQLQELRAALNLSEKLKSELQNSLAKAQSSEEQMRRKLQQLEKRSREAESSSLKQQQAYQKYQQNPDLLAAYKEGELAIVQELVKPTGVSGSSTIEIIRG